MDLPNDLIKVTPNNNVTKKSLNIKKKNKNKLKNQ